MKTNDNKWQWVMITSENEWNNERQRAVWQITASDNEWQLITTSGTTNDSKWERMRASKMAFKMKQKANMVPEEYC